MVGEFQSLFSCASVANISEAVMASPCNPVWILCSATCWTGCDGTDGSACKSASCDEIILEEEKLCRNVQRDYVPSNGLSHPSNKVGIVTPGRGTLVSILVHQAFEVEVIFSHSGCVSQVW
jgi:hypothetical protein